MNKSSKSAKRVKTTMDKPGRTMGIDVSDRCCYVVLVDEEGEIVERERVRCTEAAWRRYLEGEPRLRIALECGTHSPWMSRLLKQLGHQVFVANARKVPTITESDAKNDWRDAEKLALMAAFNPRLLSPLEHRSLGRQQDLNLIRARATLVRARTLLINALRGVVKSAGGRLPGCSSEAFPARARASVAAELAPCAFPLIEQIALLNRQVGSLDRQIAALGAKYPEIGLLRTVPGVGPVVASAYVLTLDRPTASNRSAGAFLGLRPRQSQSGDSDPEMRISRAGDNYLRSLLVQSAQYILGRFGPDSALRRWGLKLAQGGKRAKKRAVVAVARKLAVLLHSMWRSGRCFQPFPNQAAATAA